MKKIAKNYVSPEVDILEIKVERGFATSEGEDWDQTGTGIPDLGNGNEW